MLVVLFSLYRFVLYDPKTQLWYEVSEDYIREKVSHSLRSRPNNSNNESSSSRGRSKRKIRKKNSTSRNNKHKNSPALDEIVQHILQDQQSILRSLMHKETNRVAAEAIMRATLGRN